MGTVFCGTLTSNFLNGFYFLIIRVLNNLGGLESSALTSFGLAERGKCTPKLNGKLIATQVLKTGPTRKKTLVDLVPIRPHGIARS